MFKNILPACYASIAVERETEMVTRSERIEKARKRRMVKIPKQVFTPAVPVQPAKAVHTEYCHRCQRQCETIEDVVTKERSADDCWTRCQCCKRPIWGSGVKLTGGNLTMFKGIPIPTWKGIGRSWQKELVERMTR